MYINNEELNKYINSIEKVICYPSFTSTSKKKNAFIPKKYNNNDELVKIIIQQNSSKSLVSISEYSEYKNEEEYLFLPFSFFKIIEVEKNEGTINNPHIIKLLAIYTKEPIEDMIDYFIENVTDNLDLENLDIFLLCNNNEKIILNPIYFNIN